VVHSAILPNFGLGLSFLKIFSIDGALLDGRYFCIGVNSQYALLLELGISSNIHIKYIKQGRQYKHNKTLWYFLVFSVSVEIERCVTVFDLMP
jgi:hypothetical protein